MRILVLIALLFCSCTTIPSPDAPDILPELIYQVPLPSWPFSTYDQGVMLEMLIRVSADGSVSKVRLLTPSGSSSWDSLTLATIQQWRYSPARRGNLAIPTWIQQRVRIQFEPPNPMVLAEFGTVSRSIVDSVFALLTNGAPFDSLASLLSTLPSHALGGFLGEVDTRVFPNHIRQHLSGLRVGEFTPPLTLGDHFVIYKRMHRAR